MVGLGNSEAIKTVAICYFLHGLGVLFIYTIVPHWSPVCRNKAALTFAGVWDFEMGLRAVQLRGELMEVGWFR